MKKFLVILALILIGQLSFCYNPDDYGFGYALDVANQMSQQIQKSRESYERISKMQQERDLQMRAYLDTLPRGIIDYNKLGKSTYKINKFSKLKKYTIELDILCDNKYLNDKQIKEYIKIENKKDKDYKDKIKIEEFKEENSKLAEEFKEENSKLAEEFKTLDEYLSNKNNINNEDYKDKEK